MNKYPNQVSQDQVVTVDAQKPNYLKKYMPYVITVLIAFIVVLVLSSLFSKVFVDGISMQPTLDNGDIVWMIKNKKPTYDDIVVVKNNEYVDQNVENIIKRVCGFGGDTIVLQGQSFYLVKFGQTEKHLLQTVSSAKLTDIKNTNSSPFADGNTEYVVPQGCVFVLGDNAEPSIDSRYFGAADIKDILGVIIFK